MSLGLHETRLRRKRRVRWTMVKWVLALGVIAGAGAVAYESGSALAQRQVRSLGREVADLTAQLADLRRENTDLGAKAILVERALEEAKKRYARDVPSGPLAALLDSVREKLGAGVTMKRLAFLIASAENPRDCVPEAETKRFLVQTPLYKGANDSVSFAGRKVTVTARGETAANAEGKVEAWFDPAKPVTVRLTELGGRMMETTGKLPIHTSIVIGDRQYRYTISAGARGFVRVSGDHCAYP